MLISPAYAQAAGVGGDNMLVSLLPIVLIFVVFYFLLIRPQQKKMKTHRSMVEALRRGDRVVTGGGLIGSVTKVVSDTEVQVELTEGVRVRVLRHTIQEVMAKTEAVKEGGRKGAGAKSAANDPGPKAGGFGGFSLSKLLGGGDKPK